ncbi:MAG: NTP transferase domain-containing protein [Ignavibacteriales bacterium]|nr:NTP transferase domain-containing protein [Ignavibacteriales bacterium]
MIYLLSGPVKTGKSTRLLNWARNRSDTAGIIQYENIFGERFIFNLRQRSNHKLSADENERNLINIGKFKFSSESFRICEAILDNAAKRRFRWIVLDEYGKLEHAGAGLSLVFEKLLGKFTDDKDVNLIVVIRDYLVKEFIFKYRAFSYRFKEFSFPVPDSSMTRNIGAIILAAGFSSRMGEFKPLMNLKGEILLEIILNKLIPVSDKIVIVTGHNSEIVSSFLEGFVNKKPVETAIFKLPEIALVFNRDFRNGMFSSLVTGVKALENATSIIYHFADQPYIKNEFYHQLIDNDDSVNDYVQPYFGKKKGHPLLFIRRLIDYLVSAPTSGTLRDHLGTGGFSSQKFLTSHKEILIDLDEKSDII